MSTIILEPRKTSNSLLERYYNLLHQAKELLVSCKSEIRRYKRLLRHTKDPDAISKIQEQLDALEDLKWFLQDAIKYARLCRWHSCIEKGIQHLEKTLKTSRNSFRKLNRL
ncbi:hypothetical protein OCC_07898 [Thermococcus litoralis DSM 5473]|uniref:Uncharacterized protein n=1 Tax=Thermococcus litoralis (strain ATCC 51850 / DSM 5473 / JCM 8560 / NS-C) TaxID=523849 RepID=H3ZKX2_THELN|nr:hypothetical protein OCC_07898 [Thermococcus litoralis DSM 5473]